MPLVMVTVVMVTVDSRHLYSNVSGRVQGLRVRVGFNWNMAYVLQSIIETSHEYEMEKKHSVIEVALCKPPSYIHVYMYLYFLLSLTLKYSAHDLVS